MRVIGLLALVITAAPQDAKELRARIKSAGDATFGLEHSRIRDLEIQVKGRWGKTNLEDFNRRVYWLKQGAGKAKSWNTGQASRALSKEDRALRTTLDRVIWSFLSNRADEQALTELDRLPKPRYTLSREDELDKISWKRPKADAEYARWFDPDGRLMRAQGTTLAYQDTKIVQKIVWMDRYAYTRMDRLDYLKTIELESGKLTATWEVGTSGRLPTKITGTLKGVGEVEIDLTERSINKRRAAEVYESRNP